MNYIYNIPVGSNTNSGAKIRVYCSYTTTLYLALSIRSLF